MRLLRTIIDLLWEKLFIVFGALYVLLPTSPLNMPLTYRDPGVFLYVGWRILNGELPYKDMWDHKPPFIFYINALGLAISKNSQWGIWLLEFVSLSLAAFIGFRLIKKALGPESAVFGCLLWLLTLVYVIKDGNYSTEYTLLLQFAALWLFYDVDQSDFSNWRWFLIGLMGAIAFFTKQTAVGIWIAIALYQTICRLKSREVKRWIREIVFISAGFLTICISWVIFFGLHGALTHFWSAAFEFNFVYSLSDLGSLSRLEPLINGITPLTRVGLLQFSMIGYVIGIILILFKKSIIAEWLPLLSVGLIALPIELILISTSGRSYPHYYMTLLPVLALFAGLTFWVILSSLSSWGIPNTAKFAFVVSVVGVFLWMSFAGYKNQSAVLRSVSDETVINYIKSVTDPEDYVLLWGTESSVNYFSQRKSPTRFVYQKPLYTQGYVDEQMILEFFEDVIRNCPRLIIDTHHPSFPMYEFPIQTDAIKARIAYLQSHYHAEDKIGSWTVYEHDKRECQP